MTWRVEIEFKDGQSKTVELDKLGGLTGDNYITSLNIDESLNSKGQSPLGVVSSNILKLELRSHNKELMPENSLSPYFGLMDDSAIVRVYEGSNEFGTYFVDSWRGLVDTSNKNKIVIEAYDELSAIMKKQVPVIKMIGNVNDYFLSLLESLNVNCHIYASNVTFMRFFKMLEQGIDKSDMGNLLNTLSQSFLSYIYITRRNELKVLDMLEKVRGHVFTASDCTNVTSARVDDGNIIKYDGVKLTYCTQSTTPPKQVSQISQRLSSGENLLDSINFESPCSRLVGVGCKTVGANFFLSKIEWNRNKVDVGVTVDSECDCEINIMAQMIQNNKIIKSIGGDKAFEITNGLIVTSDVNGYMQAVLKILKLQSKEIVLTGWFDSEVEVGDVINVDLQKSMELSGRYRVTGIRLSVGSSTRSEIRGVRYIE